MRKICKNCGRSFEVYEKTGKRQYGKKRGFNCVTCSKRCSFEWAYKCQRAYSKTYYEKKTK